ncbi:cytochrome P450 [Mycena rosella]|uniref:Cytochrome P450 n=1 Tax=Mycena rosella TaxID=1033263 RepID=A0AAD7DK33_MYCRO|nr:cytochrome P450 [Mycena rosella]
MMVPPLGIRSSLWSILALGILFYWTRWRRNRSRLPLPPGPKKLPLVGNLFDMPAERQWEAYHEWSKKLNSDIIHVDVAGMSIVVLSSMEAIRDLFEKRSSLYSDRPRMPMLVELMGWDFALGLMRYGSRWRAHRKLFHDAFNVGAAKQFQPQERAAAHRLLRRILNRPNDIMEHFRHMTGALIMDVAYGIDVNSPGDRYIGLAQESMHGLSIASLPGKFLVDTIPALKYVPGWFPGAGFQRKAKEWRKVTQELLETPFAHTKRNIALSTAPPSFTSLSLAALESSNNDETGEQETIIKATAASMYSAGADTTVAALGTFVLAILENAEVQRKAQVELDAVLGPGHLPDFSDEVALPYVSAVVKEVLRWRNVTPIAIPHYLPVDDDYRGYRIPAGSTWLIISNLTLLFHLMAILHDESMYPDPHAFKPERFLLNGKLNQAVRDPETVAFGFGRRICPGRHMATSSLMITIASILTTMDIKKARDENGEEVQPSHEYFPGLVSSVFRVLTDITPLSPNYSPPLPFECSITPRSRQAVEVIQATLASE